MFVGCVESHLILYQFYLSPPPEFSGNLKLHHKNDADQKSHPSTHSFHVLSCWQLSCLAIVAACKGVGGYQAGTSKLHGEECAE